MTISASAPSASSPIDNGNREYSLTESDKQKGIERIYDRQGSQTKVVVQFSDGTARSVDFDDNSWHSHLKTDLKDQNKDSELIATVLSRLGTIEVQKMEAYEMMKEQQEQAQREAQQEDGEEEEEVKTEIVAKYSGIYEGHAFFNNVYPSHEGKPILFESINIKGVPYLLGCRVANDNEIILRKTITDKWRNLNLKPYSERSHEPYMFVSQDEIRDYINEAYKLTLDDLWLKVHRWVEKCYDTDDQHAINLVTSMIIFTYFADKIGITPYLFFYGEPGTGKGAILKIIELLGYRVSKMSLSTAAGIYRLLGDVEKGQVCMKIDEANAIDKDDTTLEVYKIGYKGDERIGRNFDPTSAENASQKFFYAYCPKFYAAEHLPNSRLVGGFMSRTLFVETFFGIPEINIEEVAAYPDKPQHKKILTEINKLRRLLFAYRLIHFGDVLPDADTNLHGRQRELCIGNLTLFQGTKVFDTVKHTFYHFIAPQIAEKRDSFNVHVATVLKHLCTVKTDPKNKAVSESSDELLKLFQEAYDKEANEVLKAQREASESSNPAYYTIELANFSKVTIDSNLIWNAVKQSLNAEEVTRYYEEDDGEDNDNNSKSRQSGSNKRKRKVVGSGSGQSVLRSQLYPDIGWSWLAHAINTVGGKSNRKKYQGRRVWIIDGQKLARHERSYRSSILEISQVEDLDNEGEIEEIEEKHPQKKEIEARGAQNEVENSTPSTPTTPPETEPMSGLQKMSMPDPSSVSGGVVGVESLGGESFYNNSCKLGASSNTGTQSALLIERPRVFADVGNHESLFYGQAWVGWDLEWDPLTSKIYAAAFVNHQGQLLTLHISDQEFDNDEGKLLDSIVAEILKYPVSFAYYSTGIQTWSGKGKDSDLITLMNRLIENGRASVIEIITPPAGYGRKRPQFKAYCKHTHIDLYSVYSNAVVKNFIEIEDNGKYSYRTHKLEHVTKAITGERGKMFGMNGLKVVQQPIEIQKEYVLCDAISVANLVACDFGKKVMNLLKEFADALNATLGWVCHTTITNWWTKIFDDMGCIRPEGTTKEDYDGALVLPCKSGYYENVALVDVSSLYPFMTIIHNIGFDTINCTCCMQDARARVPRWALIDPDGHQINKEYWICRKRVSVYRERLIIFRDLKNAADKAGQKMRKQAYKLLMNASYGAFATYGFGYLYTAVSELITGFGRFTLRVMNAVALAMNLQPIAGDTDSLFLANLKTKEQLEEFYRRCREILKVEDPILDGKTMQVDIENNTFKNKESAPISFRKFWNVMKKHYYAITVNGDFDSTKLEVEKDDRIEYSAKVLWAQFKKDLQDDLDPIPNLKRLTSEEELKNVLENSPALLMYSQKLGEDPGYINEITGEIKECTYAKESDPKIPIARAQGLHKDDICYFFKTGENKTLLKKTQGIDIGTYTLDAKYASINKIKKDIAEAWMNPLKVYLGYKATSSATNKKQLMEQDKEIELKIRKEIFGLDS